jgi:DUF438 domain-containing protein
MKKLKDITANKKRRSKQTIGCTVINPEKWEAIQEGERELQYRKKTKANKLARKKETTAKKKAATEVKKIAKITGKAAGKAAEKAAGKKTNKKGEKADHSAVINEVEEAIALLFQDIDYEDPTRVEA